MDEIQRNKELCGKYFFLIPTNCWTGKVIDNYNYSYTKLDAMPDGWRTAFGEKMCEEIMQELNKIKNEKVRLSYRIVQIKEKFGRLCWYTNWSTVGLDNVVRKYEQISERTCIRCGAAATKISKGWIEPYCDECAENHSIANFWTLEEYFKEEEDNEDS